MRSLALRAVAALLVGAGLVLVPAPAFAKSTVGVTNPQGTAVADPKYATKLSLSGRGFQSIKGGHGGIYVFFGTVKGSWRPSQGGQTGKDYFYVPDSESKNNQGFQRYVAFPGSDTGGAANGGTISSSGTWSTTITVPGATFRAVDRNGKATTIDCRKVTCGIITIGAHGVKNATNESFTPVRFQDMYSGSAAPPAEATATPEAGDDEGAADEDEAAEDGSGEDEAADPAIEVDRDSAVAGRVLTFNVVGLTPGDQIVVSLDDGLAAVGPLSVGPNGQVAGSLQLPADLEPGTHVLEVSGGAAAPTVSFAVRDSVTPTSADTGTGQGPAITFAALAGVALLGALAFAAARVRSVRRGSDAA